jgi:hypothetical protein
VIESTLDQGHIAITHHNAGPIDRCSTGSIITPYGDAVGTKAGVSGHPATYRDRIDAGFYWEDADQGGSATQMEWMAGIPTWEEVQEAQNLGTGLDHAIPLVVGHAQGSPLGRVLPALTGDGDRSNNPGYIAEGARVALPHGTDISYVETNHPEMVWMIKTLITHGALIYDKTGSGCEFVFRRAQWSDEPEHNPWRELLPLYGTTSRAPHIYMRAMGLHRAEVVHPQTYSTP